MGSRHASFSSITSPNLEPVVRRQDGLVRWLACKSGKIYRLLVPVISLRGVIIRAVNSMRKKWMKYAHKYAQNSAKYAQKTRNMRKNMPNMRKKIDKKRLFRGFEVTKAGVPSSKTPVYASKSRQTQRPKVVRLICLFCSQSAIHEVIGL